MSGVTVFGCRPDVLGVVEREALRLGLSATVTAAAPSLHNLELVAGNRCISIGHDCVVGPEILAGLRASGVSYVSTRSAGTDHIDVLDARHHGIVVENVEYSADSVADHTLMLILMAVRHARTTVGRADAGDYRLPETPGRELRDLTIGIVGTGRIGSAVIDRLRGFGCRLLGHDRSASGSVPHVPLDELLRESDVVTLHTPLTIDTHHLLDRSRLALMKPGAFLVNTGRGALVENEALIAALETGHLAGAALDVIEGERGTFYADCSGVRDDQSAIARLQRLPNVVITPHVAFYTDRALAEMFVTSLRNCARFEGRRYGSNEDRHRVRGVL